MGAGPDGETDAVIGAAGLAAGLAVADGLAGAAGVAEADGLTAD